MEEFKTEASAQDFSISYCKRSKLLLQADKKQVQNGTVKKTIELTNTGKDKQIVHRSESPLRHLAFTGLFQHVPYVWYSSVNVSSVMLDGVQTGGGKGGSKESRWQEVLNQENRKEAIHLERDLFFYRCLLPPLSPHPGCLHIPLSNREHPHLRLTRVF